MKQVANERQVSGGAVEAEAGAPWGAEAAEVLMVPSKNESENLWHFQSTWYAPLGVKHTRLHRIK